MYSKLHRPLKQSSVNTQVKDVVSWYISQLMCSICTNFPRSIVYVSNHWITISNVFSQRNEIISVYDSFSSIDLPVKAKEQIAALICCPDKYFLLEFRSVSKQRGGSDCGLFSIAFATAICFKINPVAVDFKQEDLRGHLFGPLS